MYASVRRYRVGSGSMDELMHRVDRDFAESLARQPGFVAYQLIDGGDGTLTTISTFRDAAGAEESIELAAQWVKEELADFEIERLQALAGEVGVSRAVADMLEPAHH